MAQIGNQNARNKGLMRARLISRIEQKKVMDELADALIEKALSGDTTALKEVFDRIDGKPHQSVSQDINVIREVSETDLDTAIQQSLNEAGLTVADLERLANAERH